MNVHVFTDGACSVQKANKPGGWGVLLYCPEKRIYREISGSATNTTNNLMELEAVIVALKTISESFKEEYDYTVYTDSRYVLLSILNRKEYEAKNFTKVKNSDKLKELYALLDSVGFSIVSPESYDKTNISILESNNLKFAKVVAHTKVCAPTDAPEGSQSVLETRGNNRADTLAVTAKEALAPLYDSLRMSF